jgi:hypothetical protein
MTISGAVKMEVERIEEKFNPCWVVLSANGFNLQQKRACAKLIATCQN